MMGQFRFAAVICFGVGLFVAGYVANGHRGLATPPASSSSVPFYACPMHPGYRSNQPGDAPCCGMRLVPVREGSGVATTDPASRARGAVHVSEARQQLIGVRTDQVEQADVTNVLRVPGRVAVDEEHLYPIVAAADGWVRQIGQNTAGTFVKRNQILASYYTPNFIPAQQAFLFAITTVDQLQKSDVMVAGQRPPTNLNLQVATDALRGLGMSERQIEEIGRTQQYAPTVHIYSPVDGFILARNLSPEQRFDKGSELYRIADLSRVWVMADVFEKDREFLTAGVMAIVRYQGRELHARMSNVLPQFDPESRTLKTRFELDNRELVLRPNFFVDVEIGIERPKAITVPADSVIDTGRRKTVFVECGTGCFAPREVQTGWRLGERVQITNGLQPGERIVVSGNFLIDSESRMRAGTNAAADIANPASVTDPVCGMQVDPTAANVVSTRHEKTAFSFCSNQCMNTFATDPRKYLRRVDIPKEMVSTQPPGSSRLRASAVDPVCRMEVEPAGPNSFKASHGGSTYLFCSSHCRDSFTENPGKYLPDKATAQRPVSVRGPA